MRVWIGLTLVAVAAMLASSRLGFGSYSGVFKLIASTGFILTAWAAGARHSRYGWAILAGLFFSWWGDAFLIGRGDTYFQLGLVSFLIAHVLYCVAFGIHGISRRWCLVSLGPVVVFALVIVQWLWPNVPGHLRGPVLAYIIVITSMVILALGTRGVGGPLSIPAGAILFYLSDISVAIGQFMDYSFPHSLWGLPFYFIGQLFLAVSIDHVRKRGEAVEITPSRPAELQV